MQRADVFSTSEQFILYALAHDYAPVLPETPVRDKECLRCPYCPKKAFKSQSTLNNHLAGKHSPLKSPKRNQRQDFSSGFSQESPVKSRQVNSIVARSRSLEDGKAIVMLWNHARDFWSNENHDMETLQKIASETSAIILECVERINRANKPLYRGTQIYSYLALARLSALCHQANDCLDYYKCGFKCAQIPAELELDGLLEGKENGYFDIKRRVSAVIKMLPKSFTIPDKQLLLIKECGIVFWRILRPGNSRSIYAGLICLLAWTELSQESADIIAGREFIKKFYYDSGYKHHALDALVDFQKDSLDYNSLYDCLILALELYDLVRMQKVLDLLEANVIKIGYWDLKLLQRLCRALLERDYFYLRNTLQQHYLSLSDDAQSVETENKRNIILNPMRLNYLKRLVLQFVKD